MAEYSLKPRGGEWLNMSSDVLDDDSVGRTERECREQEYQVVGRVFMYQNAPTAQEEARWLSKTVECLRALGFEVLPDSTLDEAFDIAPVDAVGCYNEAAGIEQPAISIP